ncbi:hypothetical protein FQN50_006824 [Emmonsiellopsis sp. PD_5]|nr:hypothetical protein FQN50_006824 [Emmonsiellopsis sp. PD_5]
MQYPTLPLPATYVIAAVPIVVFALFAATGKYDVFSKSWLSIARLFNVINSNAHGDNRLRGGSTLLNANDEPSVDVSKESDFPANWWTGEDVFLLERRAVFSKTWLFIAHSSRFIKPGDYHAFDVCGFPLFLIRGKDGVIRAFHNVCRHRAYSITRKKSGSSTVLGCRYHGWSYDTRGNLVKAPQFETLESFDKRQNGLFEIRTKVTKHGLVFVNLDAGSEVDDLDEGVFDKIAGANRISRGSVWIDGWEMERRFNWKMAVQNLNGQNAPGLGQGVKLEERKPVLRRMFGVAERAQVNLSSLELFPTTSLHVVREGSLWYSVSVIPAGVGRTSIRCDLYGSQTAKEGSQKEVILESLRATFESRLAELEATYKILVDSETNDFAKKETNGYRVHGGPGGTQEDILTKLKAHLKLERVAGEEILPTVRRSDTSAKYKEANECRFCHAPFLRHEYLLGSIRKDNRYMS